MRLPASPYRHRPQIWLFVFLFAFVLLHAAVAEVEIPLRLEAKPDTGPDLRLLAPFKDLLTGRSWLIAEGLDPGMQSRPGWNTLNRMDLSSIKSLGGNPAPTMQAVGGGFMVPFRNPAPAFSRDVLISRDFSASPLQTEPHLAVNPDDPDHIVVGMIDYNFPSNSSYVTYDGGTTWEGPYQGGYLPDDLISGGDPVLGFDRDGNVYMASISIGIDEFTIGPLYTSSQVSSIAVAKSDDGGQSWPTIVSTARSGVTISDQEVDPSGRLRGTVAVGFLDKPWMAIGPHHEEQNRDVIYVVYTDFVVYYEIFYMGEFPALLPREMSSTIRMVKSEDEGVTWSDPVDVSPTVRRTYGEQDSPSEAPGIVGTDRTVQGSRPVVHEDGTLYVAWIDSTDDGSMEGLGEMNVVRSEDGGATFSEPVVAAMFNESPFRPRNAFFRFWASSFPQLDIGPDGELYIAYGGRPADKPRDDGDIFLVRSMDEGQNWSRPTRLNGDDSDSLQFFPSLSVGPDGKVHVMWADMRDDPSMIRYHIYYTQSEDQGESWGFELPQLGFTEPDTRVTDFGSNPNRAFPGGLFIGDYWGIEATEEDVYMVWSDSRLGEFGGYNQKIAFARQRAIQSPDIFVSPAAGAGGQSITVQGFNFQPDMNVMVQLQDATIATARTNTQGRFTAGIYVPVTGEGPQTLRVFDESGNMASTSFYTEFGFDNVQRLYQDILDSMDDIKQTLEGRQ